MAYIVARPKGRFEIRESVHTPQGPRARSLANFSLLTDDVLAMAGVRATRPFDPVAVLAAADRTGAPVTPAARMSSVPVRPVVSDVARRFVESSRRMARAVERLPTGERSDPGEVLIGLLDFAEQVAPFGTPRPPEPLRFPPLARLIASRP